MRSLAPLPAIIVVAFVLTQPSPVRGADLSRVPALPGGKAGPVLTAQAAVLLDVETGQVLFEQNADEPRYPASLTKIMTALLAVESGDLDAPVTVSQNAASVGESTAHLEPGDEVSLRNLLAAALLPSANDAAVAIAEHVAGSLPSFVERMNVRARELGLRQTHFENPHGLHHAEHISSARDLAQLSRVALSQPEFRRIVALEKASFTYRRPGVEGAQTRELTASNRLLRTDHEQYWEPADGVKTGYTSHAGRCLSASATVDGWQLVCVVLGCKDCWSDARGLLEWGFANYRHVRVVTASRTTAQVHVTDGKSPLVEATAKSSIEVIVPADHPLPRARLSEAYPEAPVRIGDQVGELVVSRLDGTELRATLVAAQDVPRSFAARLREHVSALVLGMVGLALLGAVLVHGAVGKAAGTRRRRVAKSVRGDREGGAGERGRPGDPASRTSDRSETRSGAA